MYILTSILEKIVIRAFSIYFKCFRYAGVLFLVLLIECVCLLIYADNELGMAEVRSESIQITDITVEKGLDSEKNMGYHFYLTLNNNGSRRAIASGRFVENENGFSIISEEPGVYQEIDNWGSLYSGVIVPPGSEAQAEVFIKEETLEREDTEYLVFKAGYDGGEFKFPIEELP